VPRAVSGRRMACRDGFEADGVGQSAAERFASRVGRCAVAAGGAGGVLVCAPLHLSISLQDFNVVYDVHGPCSLLNWIAKSEFDFLRTN
jgi:hypothetical protein